MNPFINFRQTIKCLFNLHYAEWYPDGITKHCIRCGRVFLLIVLLLAGCGERKQEESEWTDFRYYESKGDTSFVHHLDYDNLPWIFVDTIVWHDSMAFRADTIPVSNTNIRTSIDTFWKDGKPKAVRYRKETTFTRDTMSKP